MMRTRTPRGRRGDETGATLVEFAFVAPVVFLMIFGLIAGCYLVFQDSSLHDGATAGARMASISLQKPMVQNGTSYCESNNPTPIETAVSQSAPLLPVNPNPLCGPGTDGNDPTTLTQTSVPGDVAIGVQCEASTGDVPCNQATTVQVTLTYSAKGLVSPFGLTYNMTSSSQDPILSP
jgi:hypothetical protein